MGAVILLIVFVFPMISGVIGAACYFIWKKVWIGPLIVLIASLILLFTLASGNSSFMFWVVLYTAIALATSVVTLFLRKLLFN
ncbi:hypothetical protein AU385_03025 [Bacillus halotolerans]|uniref:DUF2651 family protein n=1 Tax=Bacillus TaxID=1386 RepID=UPI00075027A7|nr:MULTISPECIES: DUF2651 family protein [Bacillus]KUP34876.1 hypothetical protein AU385_03025 [Bacillus halotolerans]OEC78703.1 DUF2651 domain-containing protein [Bacillus halotolerans]PHI45532.1 DUF2651 domain-containing protein [Bacillus halotolerans]UZD51479.1 YbeF family protein [Bacillus halotolerans]WEY45138.1 DUF2651 family protein [Bacillus sp. B28]